MSDEQFNIRFNEQGAADVIKRMREVVSAGTDAAEATENLSDQLSKVQAKANPAQAAYEKLAAGIDVLGRAQKAGIITSNQEAQSRTNLIGRMEAQIRPFSTLVSSIQNETRALSLNRTERDATLRTMQQLQSLQARGVTLSGEEREALTRTNLAYVQQREAIAATAAAERSRVAAAQTAAREIAAAARQEAQAKVAAERTAASEKAAILRSAQTTANQGARRDSIVGAVVPKIEAETAAYRLNTVERNANLRTIQQSEALRTSGINLTDEETRAILQANVALAQQREANQLLATTERELNSVRGRTSTNPAQAAQSRLASDRATVGRAGAIGLISSSEQAALERQLGLAYEAQINPLIRTNELLQQRASYQSGLFESGRALALVERDVASAEEAGIAVSREQIATLRAQAQQIDRVEGAYRSLKTASGLLGNVIGGFALAGGAGELGKSLDETTNVRNLVGVTSTGKDNQQDVTKDVYKAAEDTRSSVESTAKLYSRLELGAARFGYGQKQILGLTKEVNEQIRLSGTSEGEATRAVIDFAHAIGSGNVQFRELRALTQQAPFVSLEIAKGLTALAKEGTAQGNAFRDRALKAGVDVNKRDITVGDLKELTSKKALGSPDIVTAQALEADDTQKKFEALQPTIAQAGVQLKTFFLDYLDGANQSSGASGGIARGIEFIGKNLDKIIPTALILGSVLAGIFVAEKIAQAATLFGVLAEKIGIGAGASKIATGATNGNTTATERNSISQVENKVAIDEVTAALARQAIARKTASATAGPAAPASGAGVAAEAEGAVAGVGVAEAEAGAAGGLGLAGIASGLGIIIPLIFGAVAAYALLKDTINLASNQSLVFEANQKTALTGSITLGDVVGGIFDIIGGKSDAAAAKQKANSADITNKDAEERKKQGVNAQASFDKTNSAYAQLHNGLIKGIVDITSAFLIGANYIANSFAVGFDKTLLEAEKLVQGIANLFIDLQNKTVNPLLRAGRAVGIGSGAVVDQSHVDLTSGRQRILAGDENRRNSETRNLVAQLPNALAGAIFKASSNRQTARPGTETDGNGNGDDGLPPDKVKKAKVDPLIAQFDELLKKAFPAIAAIQKFNEQMGILAKATEKGYLSLAVSRSNALDAAHPEYGLGQLTDKQASDRITQGAVRERDKTLNPIGDFVDKQSALRSNLSSSTSTDPFQRTQAKAIADEEEREAGILGIQVSELRQKATLVAQIVNQVTLTGEAEQADKVRLALAAQAQERTRQISQLGQSTTFIKAQNDAYTIYKDQLLEGKAGAKEAYDAQVAQNVSFEQLKTRVDAAKASYETIIGPAKEFNVGVQALNDLLGQGLISIDQYDKKVRDLNSTFLATKTDAGSGIQRAFLDINKEATDSAADMERTFKDAYNNIESGFSSLFTGGDPKAALHKVLEGVTNDLSKTLFHSITAGPVAGIANSLGIKGFGDKAIQTQRTDITATNVYVNGQQAGQLGNGSAGGGLLGGAANDNGITAPGSGGLFGGGLNLDGSPSGGGSIANLLSGGGSGSLLSGNPLAGLGLPADPLAGILGGGGGGGSALTSLLGGGGGGGGLGGLSSLLGGGGGGLGGLTSLLGGGGGAAAGGGGITSLISSILPFFGFATGGSFNVGGSGGTDSQVVSFKATPGENVSVGTPDQLKTAHDAAANAGAAAPQVNQKIVNVMDPQAALDAMGTQAGFKVVLNHIASNPEAIKRALGG